MYRIIKAMEKSRKCIVNKVGTEVVIFADTFEYDAFSQVKNLSNYTPYQNSKIRIMPDAHAGKGCTIGTTMVITDSVTPNLVGVDIGCGMLVVSLKESEIDLALLDKVIREKVPSGFSINTKKKANFDFKDLRCAKSVDLERALLSIGTLGGGNHFIEVAKSEEELFLIIHSGSRHLGVQVCKHYQDIAYKLMNECSTAKTEIINKLRKEGRENEIEATLKSYQKPEYNKDLAHLTGKDMQDYLNDMKIVQEYACVNRATIAKTILTEMGLREKDSFSTIHNYIDTKNMILRKGAVSAQLGEKFIVPINMRDGSLICVGKGNEDWNYSAPHGAGRLMSRSKAKELIDVNEYEESMKGIFTTCVGMGTIDESPQAYKSIDEIYTNIQETAEVVDIIKPIYNYKAN